MTSTPKPEPVLVCVADTRAARVLRGHLDDRKRVRLEEVDRIELHFLESQHDRRAGMSRSAGGYTHTSQGHEEDERLATFGRDIAALIGRALEGGRGMLTMVAGPKLLGAVRKALPKHLADRIADAALDLGGLDARQLAAHPELARLLAGGKP